MKAWRILLLFCLALTTGVEAETANPAKFGDPNWPIEQAVNLYNSMYTGERMYAALKIGASDIDNEYLESLEQKYGATLLPWATAKPGGFQIYGLEHPVMVIDLQKRLFSYHGVKIELTLKDGYEKLMTTIEQAIAPKQTALMNWVLPRAEAMTTAQIQMLVGGLATVGGGAIVGNCLSTGGFETNTLACAGGGVMGVAGIAALVVGLTNKKSSPQEMKCHDGHVTIYDQFGHPAWRSVGNFRPPRGYLEVPHLSKKQIAKRMKEFCRFQRYQAGLNAWATMQGLRPGMPPVNPPGYPAGFQPYNPGLMSSYGPLPRTQMAGVPGSTVPFSVSPTQAVPGSR